jgi:predicted alpha-1,2-mannosidase
MKNQIQIFSLTSLFLISLQLNAQETSKKLVDYVNPFIGTGAFDANSLSGNTFPGATAPFGMVQLSPDTRVNFMPVAGYDYNDTAIYGFSHTHLSGTGVDDLYDILVMPGTGDPVQVVNNPDTLGVFWSNFSHNQEKAKPGYYQVYLPNYKINAELTATEHVGFHKYTFPKSKQAHILIDLNHPSGQGRIAWYPCKIIAQVKVINNHTIEGYRISTGWGVGFRKVYFRAEFSKPFAGSVLMNATGRYEDLSVINGSIVKAMFNFETNDNEPILMKVGLSATSNENAKLNLETELPGWDFDGVTKAASESWEKELNNIVIDGTPEQKVIFYTGLYHTFVQPINIADVNGDYPATDMTVSKADDNHHYTNFSLWDSYRGTSPLYTLVQTKRTAGFINSMIRQYDTYGYLPVIQMWGLENDGMIGNHSFPVITDAALKGIKGFDLEKAYEAVKNSALTGHYSEVTFHGSYPFSVFEKYGYLPEDILSQSVSMTLEVSFDNWCVAQFAKKLGKTADFEAFMKRSEYYKNLFDNKTHFFRAKNKNGNWIEPFDPLKYGGNGDNPYTEGNAWQYLFYVPHDVNNLINLLGGPGAFCAKLDTFFTFELNRNLHAINSNASGLIGQYAHGNEPSHHVAYLYNYAGQPWKSQKYVAEVLNNFYNTSFSGLTGNEDCGQMSAWYIFSAIGFYPVNPDNGVYVIGSPTLASAKINLDNGKIFEVKAKNASKENIYIQSAKLNGVPYTKTYITQNDIVKGGILEFVMGKNPNKQWGIGNADVPLQWGY